jgi:outer membrane protein OmpA-like peptidoglycan-associated protein
MHRVTAILIAAGAVALAGCTLRAPEGLDRVAGSGMDGGEIGSAIGDTNRAMISEQELSVDLTRRFARAVPSKVSFAFDSARLSPAARDALAKQAAWIKRHPTVRFRVYGHTDKVGPAAYNKRLGRRRAQAVVRHLVRQGVAGDRLEAVASFGETRPLVMTEGRERRNRRTVTEVSGFVGSGPRMVFDGRYMRTAYGAYVESAAEPQEIDATGGE